MKILIVNVIDINVNAYRSVLPKRSGPSYPSHWGKTGQWRKILVLQFTEEKKKIMILVFLTKCVCVVMSRLRRTSTRARTRLGSVADYAEANYVISAFCPRTSVGIIVPFVLTAGLCPRNQSGRDKDSERSNLSGICGQVAE